MDETSPSDNYELFVELFTKNEASLRAFARSLMPTWQDADEVVQEVALVAWRKFDEFEEGTSFISWVCTIARFKALSYRRKLARDRLSFREELIELMADEGVAELDARNEEYDALEVCLKKLPPRQRDLVNIAYTPGLSVKTEAEKAGIKPGTLYMRLNRIRSILFDCIQVQIKKEKLA